MTFEVVPIATVRSPRTEPIDDDWGAIVATITLTDAVSPNGELTVRGLDAIDGTPVIDIKPYMAELAPRGEVREPDWARELMRGYW